MKEQVFRILGIAVGLTMALYVAQAAVGAALDSAENGRALRADLAACQPYLPGGEGMQGEVDTAYFTDRSEAFAIAANQYGYAVFQDPAAALDQLKSEYSQGIHLIQRNIFPPVPLTRHTYTLYENRGWQLTDGYGDALEQAVFVDRFLDIYENSFEPHGG